MRRARNPEEMDPQDWSDEEAPEKYEAMTMGDDEDQDDEETLAVQSDARDRVETRGPALRHDSAPQNRVHGDTREDSGARLDDVNGASAEVNTPQPPRPRRGSGRPASSETFGGKKGDADSRGKRKLESSSSGRSTRSPARTSARSRRTSRAAASTSKRSTRSTASKQRRAPQQKKNRKK